MAETRIDLPLVLVIDDASLVRRFYRDALERAEKEITATHFIILNANAEPSLGAGITFAMAGLAMLLGMILYSRRQTAD